MRTQEMKKGREKEEERERERERGRERESGGGEEGRDGRMEMREMRGKRPCGIFDP